MTHKSKVDRPCKGGKVLFGLDTYVCIDLETSGLSPSEEEIIEFAAVLVENGNVVDTFSSLANPGFEVSKRITKVTGITNEMLAEAPPVKNVLDEFLHFIQDYPLVGHNVGFDINFVYDSSMRHFGHPIDNCYADTLSMSRASAKTLPDHKLGTMLEHYGIVNDSAHRALSDALCTQQLYEVLKRFMVYDVSMPESPVFGGYDYESIYESVLKMSGGDRGVVELRKNKNGAAIYMFGAVAFNLRINSRTQCIETNIPDVSDYIYSIEGSEFRNDVYRFPISVSAEHASAIAEMIQTVYSYRMGSAAVEKFGCCSDFLACSDAKECLKKHNPEYAGCYYRKNLEAGKIFYGKNKNC